MTLAQHRNKIGKFILFANFGLFVLIFVLFVIGGYTDEELINVLKFLLPIKSIYMTALVKHVVTNRNADNVSEEDNQNIKPLYKNVTDLIVYSHILLLSLFVVLCGINLVSFDFLINSIAIIETFFGAYVGIIITDLFKVDKTDTVA